MCEFLFLGIRFCMLVCLFVMLVTMEVIGVIVVSTCSWLLVSGSVFLVLVVVVLVG